MPPPMRGRGRGGRGGYGYPPDYYGYEDYYDDYYGYDYHDYRGGYEDPYYGYDDGYAVRGRGGGRGGRGAPPPPRGRGAPPPRGRAGYSQRGAPLGPPRGSRGGRGGPAQQQRGRGSRGARGNRGGNVGGKRKADGYNQPDSKRRQTNNQQNWGSQPIASNRFSKVVTVLVTMVTIMTTTSFIRILMGNSGNRQVRAYQRFFQDPIDPRSTFFKQNWRNCFIFK